jgi:membrane fusion protein (multidrug efflux system)
MKGFMKWVKWILEIALGVGLLVWAIYLVMYTKPTRGDLEKKARPMPVVYVDKVGSIQMEDTLGCLGTAAARESVVVTAQVSEKIVKIAFEDGQVVKQGDVLVELDNARERAAMQVVELTIAEHTREQARLRQLREADAIAQKDLDDRETRLAMAKAERLRVEADLADRVIKAPFSGVLGLRLVSLGDLVSPGTKITTLDDIDELHIDFPAPEKYLVKLSPGQPFKASNAAYPGVVFEGVIKMIESRVNAQTRSVQVRGVMANPDYRIKPGMLLNVSLSTSAEEVTVVPESALVSLGERQYLFVLPEGPGGGTNTVVKTEVKVGRRVDRWAEVTGGIERGATIVTDGIGKIADGQQVAVGSRMKGEASKGDSQ